MSSGAVRAGGVFVEIGADPTKFFSAFSKVNKQLRQLGSSMARAGGAVSAAGSAIVGPIFASAAAFASVGSALNDMSKRTGVAAESLSVLKFAAEQTGTDMAGVETAVKKMQKTIYAAGNGSEEAAKALESVGLSAADLEGLSADQQMGKIADGLMAIDDPGTRAAIAMQVFGKSGTAILPMLEGGSRGMADFAAEAMRLGLVMDSETAAKADALGDAMDAMTAAMKMAFIQVGGAVAPALTKMAQGLAYAAGAVGKFVKENQEFVGSALRFGVALVGVGAAMTAVGVSLQAASYAFEGIGKAVRFAASPLMLLVRTASMVGRTFLSTTAIFAKYTAALAVAVARTIAATAAMSAAWIASAVRGVVVFAATAVAGIASYLAAASVAVVGSVASATAIGAAWLVALWPFTLMAAALAGVAYLAYSFSDSMKKSLSDVGTVASQAGSQLSQSLGTAVSDGMAVFNDLAGTATTTFNGVYEAISNGELTDAMDILWAGLLAGWLRGVEALMGYVDPWISFFQNTFTYLSTYVLQTWDMLWTNVSAGFNTFGAAFMSVMDSYITPILATWDTLEAGIRKSWIRISGIFGNAKEKQAALDEVDAEMADRAAKREEDHPGMQKRMQKAKDENDAALAASVERRKQMGEDADKLAQERLGKNKTNAEQRRKDTEAAVADLGQKSRRSGEKKVMGEQYADLLKQVENATTLDQLRDLYGQFDALNSNGRLTSSQADTLQSAIDDAQERISRDAGMSQSEKAARGGAEAAASDSQTSKGEVAGTFSSNNLAGMGIGSSIAERQLKTLESIDKNTKGMGEEGRVAA